MSAWRPSRSAWGRSFPDVVLTDGKKLAGVVEVETGESVNNLEALAQWAHFSRAKVPFHLYVPVSGYDTARRLCEANDARPAEIWTYRGTNEGFDLVRIFQDPSAAASVKLPSKPAAPARPAAKTSKPAPAAKVAKKPAARPGGAKAAKKAAKPAKESRRSRPQEEVDARALHSPGPRQARVRPHVRHARGPRFGGPATDACALRLPFSRKPADRSDGARCRGARGTRAHPSGSELRLGRADARCGHSGSAIGAAQHRRQPPGPPDRRCARPSRRRGSRRRQPRRRTWFRPRIRRRLARYLGAAEAARLRTRYNELVQRVGRRARSPEERDRLLDRAKRLNPDGWPDESTIRAQVASMDAACDAIVAELPSRRRGRRGGRRRAEEGGAAASGIMARATTPNQSLNHVMKKPQARVWMLRVALPVLAATAWYRPSSPAKPRKPTPTYGSATDLSPRTSSSATHSGQFIPDLTIKDFEVYEDGVLQNVTNFAAVIGGRAMTEIAPVSRATVGEGLILPKTQPVTADQSGTHLHHLHRRHALAGAGFAEARQVLKQIRDTSCTRRPHRDWSPAGTRRSLSTSAPIPSTRGSTKRLEDDGLGDVAERNHQHRADRLKGRRGFGTTRLWRSGWPTTSWTQAEKVREPAQGVHLREQRVRLQPVHEFAVSGAAGRVRQHAHSGRPDGGRRQATAIRSADLGNAASVNRVRGIRSRSAIRNSRKPTWWRRWGNSCGARAGPTRRSIRSIRAA